MEPGMASAFSGARGTQMGVPWATRELKAVISFCGFCSYDLEATVSERPSRVLAREADREFGKRGPTCIQSLVRIPSLAGILSVYQC